VAADHLGVDGTLIVTKSKQPATFNWLFANMNRRSFSSTDEIGEWLMKQSKKRQRFFGTVVMALLLATSIPAIALGQGRGRGPGRRNAGNISWPIRRARLFNQDKKCAKFVNCHDASEGRWDGRGPRGSRVGNILSTRVRRHRNFDGSFITVRSRRNRELRDNYLRNRGRRVGRR
jgi:hypothetical protein